MRAQNRTNPAAEVLHWMGEGEDGQDTLALEFDGRLYAADDTIHRLVSSAAHAYDGNERRPFALLLPLPDTIGWQIGYLAKFYNTFVLHEDMPDGLEAASDFFNVRPLSVDEASTLDTWLDLVVCTNYLWDSPREFRAVIRELLTRLSPEGRLYAVLSGRAPLTLEHDADIVLQWQGADSTLLSTLLEATWGDTTAPEITRSICLPSLNPLDPQRLLTFTKRNRRFFGKEAPRRLAQQLDLDPDCRRVFELPPQGADVDWLVVLRWESAASY